MRTFECRFLRVVVDRVLAYRPLHLGDQHQVEDVALVRRVEDRRPSFARPTKQSALAKTVHAHRHSGCGGSAGAEFGTKGPQGREGQVFLAGATYEVELAWADVVLGEDPRNLRVFDNPGDRVADGASFHQSKGESVSSVGGFVIVGDGAAGTVETGGQLVDFDFDALLFPFVGFALSRFDSRRASFIARYDSSVAQ